jgi:phage shock protein C
MKRLYRSNKNTMIAGVCGGIAEYFNVDPVIVRVLAVMLFFAGGSALLAYILGIIIIPKEPYQLADEKKTDEQGNPVSPAPLQRPLPPPPGTGMLIGGLIMIAMGVIFSMRSIPFMRHYYWWFWDHAWHFFWPAVIIVIGFVMIIKGMHKDESPE